MSLLRRTSLILALATTTLTGCSQREGGAPVQPGADDGRVVEVSGAVTATRGGATRPLAVGDSVSGDDVIATGADGRVAIQLHHNHVHWSLGPGRQRKLSDSGAWAAGRATGSTVVTDERSGAAGRHAEREAADTAASAPAAQAAPTAAAPPAPAAEVAAGGEMRMLRSPAAGLTDEQIAAALKPRLAAMRACGEVPAPVQLTFAIDAGGRVTGLTLLAPPELATLRDCLLRAVKPVRFPAGEADRTATYSLGPT